VDTLRKHHHKYIAIFTWGQLFQTQLAIMQSKYGNVSSEQELANVSSEILCGSMGDFGIL
jgi:hypothetical protein